MQKYRQIIGHFRTKSDFLKSLEDIMGWEETRGFVAFAVTDSL